MEEFLVIVFKSILGAILTPTIKIVAEKIRSIKDKPRFFIYELFFKGFSIGGNKDDEMKKYQMKGRLVGNTNGNYHFKSFDLKLPFDCEWKNDSKYSCYKKGNNRQWKPIDKGITPTIDGANLTITIDNLNNLEKSTTYDIIGNYAVPNEPKDLSQSFSSLEVFSEVSSKKKNEKDEEKIEKLKVKKCPNIRKSWLLFYVFFSIFVLFLGTASILGCINNWNYFVDANFEMYFVFGVFGLILLIIMVFFVCVCWKTLSAYYVLIKMKKFGIPLKTQKVAQKLLVPTIFEFMTGTETIDNIL